MPVALWAFSVKPRCHLCQRHTGAGGRSEGSPRGSSASWGPWPFPGAGRAWRSSTPSPKSAGLAQLAPGLAATGRWGRARRRTAPRCREFQPPPPPPPPPPLVPPRRWQPLRGPCRRRRCRLPLGPRWRRGPRRAVPPRRCRRRATGRARGTTWAAPAGGAGWREAKKKVKTPRQVSRGGVAVPYGRKNTARQGRQEKA